MKRDDIVDMLASGLVSDSMFGCIALRGECTSALASYLTELFIDACAVGYRKHGCILDSHVDSVADNFKIFGMKGVVQRPPIICVHANVFDPVTIDVNGKEHVLYFQYAKHPPGNCRVNYNHVSSVP